MTTSAGCPLLADPLDGAARVVRSPAPDFGIARSTWRANPVTRPVRALLLPTRGIAPSTFLRVRSAGAVALWVVISRLVDHAAVAGLRAFLTAGPAARSSS